jgi:hypothetical protein
LPAADLILPYKPFWFCDIMGHKRGVLQALPALTTND